MDNNVIAPLVRNQVAAVMIVLTTIGALIAIPIPFSPVPIVLQNAFVVLTGLLIVPKWAAATLALYLLLGAIGLPIFSGGTGGIARLVGPTGGYLLGYPVAAALCSTIVRARFGPDRVYMYTAGSVRLVCAIAVGFLVPYISGVAWLARTLDQSIGDTLAIGFFPFIGIDAIEASALFLLVRFVPDSIWKRFT